VRRGGDRTGGTKESRRVQGYGGKSEHAPHQVSRRLASKAGQGLVAYGTKVKRGQVSSVEKQTKNGTLERRRQKRRQGYFERGGTNRGFNRTSGGLPKNKVGKGMMRVTRGHKGGGAYSAAGGRGC